MLAEVKTDALHYFVDAKGRIQGEYKRWWINGTMWEHCFYIDDKCHGECKWWRKDGTLMQHYFWDNGKVYRNLIIEPVDDKDKFLLTIETGGKWLC